MSEAKVKKIKPDIRAITRLVPPSGNLVQGQSELPIDPQLAKEAADIIAASRNHYGGSEGDMNLRKAVAEKIKRYNGIDLDVDAKPLEVMITNGGTGALIGLTISYLQGKSALVLSLIILTIAASLKSSVGKPNRSSWTRSSDLKKMHCSLDARS
jgi:aminotransferase